LNVFSAANALPGVYLYPLVWPADTLNSREAQMFVSDDFPKFKYGNTITDVDPQWVDPKIYEHEANFILWTKPASYVHALGQPAGNYPAATEWAQWWWIPSGDISDNSVWPVFNGVYTNKQTLKGSIEINVPLGDLNWFPEAKAAWEANKAAIQAHIKNGNETQISIGYLQIGVSNVNTLGQSAYIANDMLKFKGYDKAVNVEVYSILGKKVISANNITEVNVSELAKGVYMVRVNNEKQAYKVMK